MLAGNAAEAAHVVRSFKKSRRSVPIGRFHLAGLPAAVIAGAKLVSEC
jgi:hypothetical protein